METVRSDSSENNKERLKNALSDREIRGILTDREFSNYLKTSMRNQKLLISYNER